MMDVRYLVTSAGSMVCASGGDGEIGWFQVRGSFLSDARICNRMAAAGR